MFLLLLQIENDEDYQTTTTTIFRRAHLLELLFLFCVDNKTEFIVVFIVFAVLTNFMCVCAYIYICIC